MRRRDAIFGALVGVGAALSALPKAVATQPPQPLRVGMATIALRSAPFFSAFIERMAELGYVEGKNFTLEFVASLAGFYSNLAEI